LLTLLALGIVAVGLLPWLVAKTSLRNTVLSMAIPGDQLRAVVGEASLNWFSSPALSRFEVRDSAGNLLVTAERISIDRAGWQLLVDQSDLGTIEIVRPTIHLALRPDGSNIEDAIQHVLAEIANTSANGAGNDEASPAVAFAVRVVEGTILAEELATSRKWQVERVNLQFDSRGTNAHQSSASLSAELFQLAVGGHAAPAGRLTMLLEPGQDGRQRLTWHTEQFSLAAAEPWLRRAIVAAEMGGTLSGQGTAVWTASPSRLPADLTTSGLLTVDALDVSAPALNGDRLKLARVELPWRVQAQPTGLVIEDLRLRSDIGQLAARGTLDSAVMARVASLDAAVLDPSARHDVEFRTSIDIAKVATMLPKALRIRPGMTITSGLVELAAICRSAGPAQVITMSLNTNQLAAVSGGRQLRWEQPVNAQLTLHRENRFMRLDSLACESEFLQIAASGTPQDFSANAEFDLNRLAQQLGQFVDFGSTQLAGRGAAEITWKQTGNDNFAARATGSLTELRVASAQGSLWSEPQLKLDVTAAGVMDSSSRRPSRVDSARMQLDAQGDALDAQLTGPALLTTEPPIWPISITATGRIARWLTRMRPWYAPDPWHVDGDLALTAHVRMAASTLELNETQLVATGFQASRPGWSINEPRVEFTGNARWNADHGEIATDSAQLVTSTVSLALKNMQYRGQHTTGPDDAGQMSGIAAFRAEMSRLAAWRATAEQPSEYLPQGAITGNVRFVQQQGRITGELTATGQNMALRQKSLANRSVGVPAPDYHVIWQEPQISLRGLAAYDAANDRLEFNQLAIQSNTLQVAASGQVDQLSAGANTTLTGSANYDLAQITLLLRPYLGEGIQLAGREQARFALSGSMASSQNLAVQPVGLSIQSASRNPGFANALVSSGSRPTGRALVGSQSLRPAGERWQTCCHAR
jgi:hypothetical protein